jgi:hypothetical protein
MPIRAKLLGLPAPFFALFIIVVLWSVPYVPTSDGPNHLANCVMAKKLRDPTSALHAYLEPGTPITYRGYDAVCGMLVGAFGWRWAHRLALTLIALSFALGYAYLARSVVPDHVAALLGFGYALSWPFFMGFFDFLIASCFLLFIFGWVLRRSTWTKVQWVELSGALLATALVHVFVAAEVGLLAMVAAFRREERRERLRAIGATILAGIPAAILALAARVGTDAGGETVWLSSADSIRDIGARVMGGTAIRAWVPVAFALVALGLWLRDLVRRPERSKPALLGVAAILFLMGYFVSPLHWVTWQFLSPRFAFFGLALAPLSLPARFMERTWIRRFAFVAIACFDVYSIAWARGYEQKLEPIVEEALSGLRSPIHRDGARLPLMLIEGPRDIPDAQPLAALGQLYLLDQGGVDPYLHADSRLIDGVLFKRPAAELFGEFPSRWVFASLACAGQNSECPPLDVQSEWFAMWGRRFQDVILFGDDPQIRRTFEARGYAVDFAERRLAILRPRACRVTLRVISNARSIAAPLRFILGRKSIPNPMTERTIPADATNPDDGFTVGFVGPDCGALWLRLAPDPILGKLGCEEANAAGEIEVNVTPEGPADVRCTLTHGG